MGIFATAANEPSQSGGVFARTAAAQPTPEPGTEPGALGVGVAKALGNTLHGAGTLGQGLLDQTAGRALNAVLGNGFKPTGAPGSVPAGANIYRPGTPESQAATDATRLNGTQEAVGGGLANIGIAAGALATGNPAGALEAAGATGLINAGQEGVNSLGEGHDFKHAAVQSFIAGLTGAAVGGVSKAASTALSSLASHAPESLYNNALKVLQKLKSNDASPAAFLKDEGVWGSLGTFQKAATEGMGTENAIIKQAAYNTEGGVTADEIKQKATQILSQKLGDLYSAPEVQQLVDAVPMARIRDAKGVVSWVDADGVRSALGSLIGDSKWMSANPSENTQAAEAVYNALSSSLKEATGTKTAFERLSHWIATNKVVGRAIDLADNKYGLGLMDYAGGIGGATIGGFSGEGDVGSRVKNAVIGGGLGIAGERLANSPALKTGVAQLLTHLSSLPTTHAGLVSKSAVMQGINGLVEAIQGGQSENQDPMPQ